VKVNTGMNRIGAPMSEAEGLILDVAALPGLRLAGICSHFASADEADDSYTRHQFDGFMGLVGRLPLADIGNPTLHIANSPAMMRFEEMRLDAVRTGCALYGFAPFPSGVPLPIVVQPVMTIKARVAHLQDVPAGQPVSYNGTYVTKRPSCLAVVALGYADGARRHMSNRGHVLVRGRRAPIVGSVCMDQTIIDVTDVPSVRMGDEVVFLGADGMGNCIHVSEMAAAAGTIMHEALSAVGARLPRVYVNESCERGADGE